MNSATQQWYKDPYRVGLKLKDNGWVYVQGLMHFEVNEMMNFYCWI